jgi:hypothetical protein
MRVIDDRHDHAQCRSDWRYNVANPIDKIEEGALRLGGRLALNCLIRGWRAAEVLRLDK